jgi:hypothetical protein
MGALCGRATWTKPHCPQRQIPQPSHGPTSGPPPLPWHAHCHPHSRLVGTVVQDCLHLGSHKSTDEHLDFVRDEMANFARKGFWTVLPLWPCQTPARVAALPLRVRSSARTTSVPHCQPFILWCQCGHAEARTTQSNAVWPRSGPAVVLDTPCQSETWPRC